MSADNWMTCPRCAKTLDQIMAEAYAKYGHVPAEEYHAELKRAREAAVNLKDTLREDYEFYWEDEGTIVASYSCLCVKCGFKHSFKYESKIEGSDI